GPPPPPGYPAPPPGWGQPPPYGAPLPPSGRNGFGVTALVLGVASVMLCWTVVIGAIGGVLAIVFGALGRSRAARGEATNGGVALAGLITGVIGLLFTVAVTAIYVAVGTSSHFRDYRDCMDRATTQQQRDDCGNQFGRDLFGN
ncbi:MAG: DUF4190 domain-containing protein, partial [Mycobacteriales bacterium]